ncbi:DUF6668 family protein [Nocardia sp. XZ_19_369]|uniref:DUF6668 family protein n=1 Tax=Nocardia sp. XZ_19_369 TaxID=2769487 RepID=UPI00189053E7|nr:DUF6668 family protein [Nocardia sp. XZ_19_369]
MAAAPIAREGGTSHDVPAGLKLPSATEQAPIWSKPLTEGSPAPAFWLLGAHGGAGVSTLARTWAPAADAQRGWPAADRYPHVVIVARTHRAGLGAAHVLLRQAAGGLTGAATLLGLVTIADADGILPATLRRQRDLVEELAPQAWRIPYLEIYRRLSVDQMPRWSPRDQPPDRKRFSRTDPDTVHPDLAEVGAAIFHAARTATTNR